MSKYHAVNTNLSVVIPTFNRKNELDRVLTALGKQTFPSTKYEIIIIDDGSEDGTAELIENYQENSIIPLYYYFQKNKGPAAARNLGIKKAKFHLILFINDDTIPADDLIEQHIDWHQKWTAENVAVLGKATWANGISVPVYAEHYLIPQFEKLEGNQEVRPVDFITCNISVKKAFLLNNGLFDEDFPYAAHEDRELGIRLGEKGLCIKYNPQALVYHYHIFRNLDVVLGHSKRLGQALAIWEEKIFDKKELLAEFNLTDFSSSIKTAREKVKDLVFNNYTLRWWRWVISKLNDENAFAGYLYQHIIGRAQREGYRSQKKIYNSRQKTP